MIRKYWHVSLLSLATLAAASAPAFAAPALSATEAPSARLLLVNYPGDAPGTMSIGTIAKSTRCQMNGYLRYSSSAGECVNN